MSVRGCKRATVPFITWVCLQCGCGVVCCTCI